MRFEVAFPPKALELVSSMYRGINCRCALFLQEGVVDHIVPY